LTALPLNSENASRRLKLKDAKPPAAKSRTECYLQSA
jgi:hypothetical protein